METQDNKQQADHSVENSGRRTLIKGTSLAAPIILASVSKSALGGECTDLSGTLSGNLSAPNVACSQGKTIEQWYNDTDSIVDTPFLHVFDYLWKNATNQSWASLGGDFADPLITMRTILDLSINDSSIDKLQFAAYSIAVYLSAADPEFPLDQDYVVRVVNEVLAGETFTVSTGQPISLMGVVDHFALLLGH